MTIKICINNGCIGCGFCSLVCPVDAISMEWASQKTWRPIIDDKTCTRCGLCTSVCPNSMGNLVDTGEKAWQHGEYFGINNAEYTYAITHEIESEDRIRSASGGTTTVLLKYLLESKLVDCVICAEPKMAMIGQPHFGLKICYSSDEVDACRSSAYGPIRYDQSLQELIDKNLSCAMTALPCTLRAIKKLPDKFNKHILYTIGIMCSHNVTDQFTDFLAHKHGIRNELFKINLRDKLRIPDANQYNTCFHLNNGKIIRTPRLKNGFTHYWRNYSFAQEACFYCPDFFAAHADISVKDAWGKYSKDPLGLTLCIIRNHKIMDVFQCLSDKGILSMDMCDQDEILNSQRTTAIYKQVSIWNRWSRHPELNHEVVKLNRGEPFLPAKTEIIKDFKKKLHQSRISRRIYSNQNLKGYQMLLRREKWQKILSMFSKSASKIVRFIISNLKSLFLAPHRLVYSPFRYRSIEDGSYRILINSGAGYGNVGDEAQLGATINRWKKLIQGCEVTVLSPYPCYTRNHHHAHAISGPRVVWFNANHNSDYRLSNKKFMIKFFIIALKMLGASVFMRAGLPTIFLKSEEASLLYQIHRSDVLHISGGGFLTGMTLSRLWENMLLIKLAHNLGTQVILSGQTIGVFKNKINRIIAQWGLKHAKFIYLRDTKDSEVEIRSLGLKGDHIKSAFDDALLCEKSSKDEVLTCLSKNGIDVEKPFIVAQFHYWGQKPETQLTTANRFAEICDYLIDEYQVQVLFIPMVQSDVDAEQDVIQRMKNPSILLEYEYDYKMARGIMAEGLLTFTLKHHPIIFSLGEGVPAVAVSFDDYYYRKNKGALLNCKLEDFCLDMNGFMGNEIKETLRLSIVSNHQLRVKIMTWLNLIKKHENDIYIRYIESNNKG